jgi:hypothetical protein
VALRRSSSLVSSAPPRLSTLLARLDRRAPLIPRAYAPAGASVPADAIEFPALRNIFALGSDVEESDEGGFPLKGDGKPFLISLYIESLYRKHTKSLNFEHVWLNMCGREHHEEEAARDQVCVRERECAVCVCVCVLHANIVRAVCLCACV